MSNSSSSVPTCFQCGSPLIFISESVDTVNNSKFPTKTTLYRCSNQACQEEKDRQEVSRIKHKTEQDKAKKEREAQRLEKRKQK